MKKITILILSIFCINLYSIGQSYIDETYFQKLAIPNNESPGKVIINQSENFLKSFIENTEKLRSTRTIQGYRICIFSEYGQKALNNANKTRAFFISKYENIKCYTIFKFPFYKIYVGDFRTKSEAYKFLKTNESDFPNAYIINDNIMPE